MSEHLPALIVLAPLAAALLAPLAALRSARLAKACALAGQLAALAACGAALARVLREGPWRYHLGGWPPPWGIEHAVDSLSASVAALFCALAVLTSLYGWDWEEKSPPVREGAFQSMLLLLLCGSLGIVLTADLFNLYVFLEIASLSSYALVASGPGRDAPAAAFRYLLMGSVGASFWVLGLGFLYAATGTLNMADLARLWPLAPKPTVAVGLALMASGLALKMPVFPLNGWQPGAYAAAPARAMPLLASVMSKAMAFALLRLLNITFEGRGPASAVLDVLGWTGAVTLVAASAAAFAQTDVRRMLAWSSAGQLGYLLVGFSLDTRWALTGAVWYLISHAVLKSCLFMTAGEVWRRRGSCSVEDFRGLARSSPWAAAGLACAGLSLAGLPPACAFFGKWFLLRGAFETGSWAAAAALAASSLLTALYVFRLLEKAYLEESDDKPALRVLSGLALACIMLLAAAGVLLGVFNEPLISALLEPAL